MAIHIGKWIDRYGIRTLVLLGGFGLLGSVALPLISTQFMMFVVSQALMGVGFTSMVVAIQKRIGNEGGDMDQRIATFSLYGSVGAMIGPVLGASLYEHFGFQISYGTHVFLISLSIIIAYALGRRRWEAGMDRGAPASNHKGGSKKTEGSVWRMLRQKDLRNAVIVSGLMLSNREIFSAYFPLLGEKMGLTPTAIGLLLSVMGAAMLVIRVCQSYMVKTFGRGNVLTWALYISGIVYAMTPFLPSTGLLLILVVILGAGLGVGQPLSLAYTIQVSPADRRGEVLGMRITFNRTSQFAVPMLFGGLGGVAGVTAVFWASGLLLLIGGIMTRSKGTSSEAAAD
jgi:MFS family permease